MADEKKEEKKEDKKEDGIGEKTKKKLHYIKDDGKVILLPPDE